MHISRCLRPRLLYARAALEETRVKRTALPALARPFLVCLAVVLASLVSVTAFADPKTEKDALALQKKAIEEDNLNVAYGAAVKKLQSAIAKCGKDKCNPALKAALVRDLGAMQILNGHVDEGKSSFGKALTLAAGLDLDPSYKNPMLDGIWNEVKKKEKGGGGGGGGEGGGGAAAGGGGAAAGGPPPAGDFAHSAPPEAPVRTPLPLYAEYTGSEELKRVVVKYKGAGMSDWKTVSLKKSDSGFGGMIPCKDVTLGNMQYFIQAFNAQNDPVGTSGSKNKPYIVVVKDEIEGPPPSLPNEEPPKQCAAGAGGGASEECPPDFPGCAGAGKDPGEDCDKDKECKSHSCLDNKCAEGGKGEGEDCEKDGECKSGACSEGKCGASKKAEGDDCGSDDECDSGKCKEDKCAAGGGKGGKFPRIWIGVGLQLDLYLMPGAQDVCVLNKMTGIGGLPDNSAGYSCVDPKNGANFPGGGTKGASLNGMIAPSAGPPTSDQVSGGFRPGNFRILASLDYALSQNLLLGLRAGYVLFTDPGSSPGPAFPPLHLEARLTYLIGHNALTKKGIVPMLFLGAGAGEFDAFVPVTVLSTSKQEAPETAWLTSGPIFVSAGGGARFNISPKVAATAALKFEGGIGGAAGFMPGFAPELGIQFGL